MEPRKKKENLVSGWTDELGGRFNELYRRLGGLKAAEAICGTSDETLGKWRDGVSRPNFLAVMKMCEIADISLDWLASGKPPLKLSETLAARPCGHAPNGPSAPTAAPTPTSVDIELLTTSLNTVGRFLGKSEHTASPRHHAVLAGALYALSQESGSPHLAASTEAVDHLLRLMGNGLSAPPDTTTKESRPIDTAIIGKNR